MDGTCLAASDDYLLTFHPATPRDDGRAAGPLVITFGGQPSGLGQQGFGTGWALQHGWDTIYVAQRHGSQYQGLSLSAFAAAVAPVVQNRDVVCYGSSLGGYAALYFAGVIEARVLAASPLLPAWPSLGRAGDQVPIQHHPIAEGPLSPHSPIIIYDPLVEADEMTVTRMILPAYPKARLIRLDYAGHTVLQALKRSGQLTPFVLGAIARDEIVPIERDIENDPVWHFRKGRALMKSRPEEARAHLERSLDLQPSRHVAGNLLGLLIRLGDMVAAQELLDRFRGHPEQAVPESSRRHAEKIGLIP